MSAHAAPTERPSLRFARRPARGRVRGLTVATLASDAWITLGVAIALSLVAFVSGAGLSQTSATEVEMALTLGGGLAVAAAIAVAPAAARPHGRLAVGLMLALAALTALSVSWSVQPDASWQQAALIVAYAATFITAVVMARVQPGRFSAVLGGVLLSGVVLCAYALLTKVLPAQLDAADESARLQAPYGYWNATGLTAALTVLGCLWLGARRAGRPALNALAYPASGLALTTLMLAYPRGALLALAGGLALWFAVVPLRLRGAAVALSGAGGAAVVVLWSFSQRALSADHVDLHARSMAGRQLGVLLVATLIALLGVGLAVGFLTSRRAPSRRVRRRAATVLIVALALVPVAVVGALATSHRGLTGSISHGFDKLTDPNANLPSNDPSRLTAVGSVRALYWDQALKVFRSAPAVGVGAAGFGLARLRYRSDTVLVVHAHGYVLQILADLGLVGLGLSLLLFIAWLASALRSARPLALRRARGDPSLRPAGRLSALAPRRWALRRVARPWTAERVALVTMLALVVVFGVHSLVDWTWFVPGNACVALLCAGWLAGRGRVAPDAMPAGALATAAVVATEPVGAAPTGGPRAWVARLGLGAGFSRLGARRAIAATVVLVIALLAAWAQWQPLRSAQAAGDSLTALDSHNTVRAQALAQTAIDRQPLSVTPLLDLSAIDSAAGRSAQARADLVRAVRLQPRNPEPWQYLAAYDLEQANRPHRALADLRAAVYLDPESPQNRQQYVDILRRLHPFTVIAGAAPPVPVRNPRTASPGG